jgi:type II secretory pathway pseudopilin PulG
MRINARMAVGWAAGAGSGERRGERAFTLAEVLAALLFMAIVIPVAVEGLRVASRAGEMAERKSVAMRVADQVLNQRVVSDPAVGSAGAVQDGPIQYRWRLQEEAWTEAALQVVTAEVTFPVQGSEFEVRLSTLLDTSGIEASTNSGTGLP